MAKASDASSYVHLGFWVNQDKGNIHGLTITVSPTTATLLTNMMALFVTMAGGQFWTILRFTLHQIRAMSTNKALDLAYNRQQVVLRNTTTATSTAQILLYLGWSSRKDVKPSSKRASSIPLIGLAVLCAIFFVIAGVFSNTIMDAGPYVLSRSPFCGSFKQSYIDIVDNGIPVKNTEQETMVVEYVSWWVRDVEHSQQYSQDCYVDDGAGSAKCDLFRKSTLPFTMLNIGSCPFDPKLCLKDTDTVVFDTGRIDSHEDLGINALPEDRMTYRRLDNCTVLTGASYTTDWINKTDFLAAQPTWRYANASYGPSLLLWDLERNGTYSYSNFADFRTASAAEFFMAYSLGVDQSYMKQGTPDPGSTFVPLPEFEQTNSDLYLFHLSYTGLSIDPVDDPWFSAHQPFDVTLHNGDVVVTYARDRPITTLACTEQHQFCTSADVCSPPLGINQVQDYVNADMTLTPKQNVTFNQLMWNVVKADLFQIAAALTGVTSPLLAVQKRQNGRHTSSVPLPNNQWKIELANWMSISMAHLQRLTVESATGQFAVNSDFVQQPQSDSEKWICQNQVIRSDVYQSFRVVAFALLLVFGTLVIVLSLVIEPLSAWLFRSVGRGTAGDEIWKAHDMLGPQLWSSRLEAIRANTERFQHRRKDSLASWDTSPNSQDEKGRKRVSSQVLSFEDHERFLIEKAYEAWI